RGRLRQHVVDDGARRRVGGRRLVLGQRGSGEPGGAHPDRGRGSEQPSGGGSGGGTGLPQRRHVVENPERAAVGGDHHVVAVHVDVAHGGDRQAQRQRLPVVPVVERHVDALLGAGV